MRENRKERNIAVFEDTMAWIRQNETLRDTVEETKKRTIFYPSSGLPEEDASCGKESECVTFLKRYEKTQVEVTSFRSLEAAMREKRRDSRKRVAVLNFASATNPGGGVTKGSSAQEESLCRLSTLYPCLNTSELKKAYYDFHRQSHDALYTDACIYTPDILVIKTDDDSPERMEEKFWCRLDVISCAAPNLRERPSNAMNPGPSRPVRITPEALLKLLKQRVCRILSVAAQNKEDILILGAFGCGAFRNPPEIAARAWAEVLPEFYGVFEKVHFAVYCRPDDMKNYLVFVKVMNGLI